MPNVQSSKGDLVRTVRDDSGVGSSGGSKKKKRGRDSSFRDRGRGSSSGSRAQIPVCYNCGKEGHISPQCSQPLSCRLCGAEGHPQTLCPQATCYGCGKPGHMQTRCPESYSPAPMPSRGQPSRGPPVYTGGAPRPTLSAPSTFRPGTGPPRGGFQQRGAGRGSDPRQGVQAQTYALPTTSDIPESSTFRGIVSVDSSWVHVLFDTGASRSFIALAFVRRMGLPVFRLSMPI
ncbi:hypothetical protein JQN44_27125 [Klebsiella pneumoniae]|nr:hypothetical protein [Klebsiella pneumoniae]